jgi:hypothetical protein
MILDCVRKNKGVQGLKHKFYADSELSLQDCRLTLLAHRA